MPVHLALLYFPLSKPLLVEGEADVDAEGVFRDEVLCTSLDPLGTDVEQRAVVISVDDRDSETQ